jgi:acyl-ACP thioesterase
VAWDHLQDSGFVETDPVWIVRRTVIDALRPINWPDRILLQRWCSATSTRWSTMRVRITSAAGGLVETEGFWINIGETTNVPTRISDGMLTQLNSQTPEHRLRWRSWLTEPPPAQSETDLSFPVRATDIDQYNHVNNAAYWQAVEQYLVDYPKLIAAPHRAVIEYNSPVLAREHITVRSRYDPGDHHNGRPQLRLWFLVADNVTTVARIMPLP